jgi:integrase
MGVNIRQKPTGSGIWWVFVNHRGSRKSKKIGKDKKLAKQYQKKLEAKILLDDLDMDKFNKTVPALKPYAEKWFTLPHKTGKGTMHMYKRNLELHVYPVIGNHQIDQIKRKDFKAMFDGLLINGMAESNFQNIKSPLSRIFHHAIDAELVQINPLAGLKHSTARTIDIKPLTEEEVFIFLDVAQKYAGGKFYAQFLTLIRTGMRIGEVLGLQWQDIDFVKRKIKVQRHMVKNVAKPGTKNGKDRTVDMTPHLAETLRTLKTEKQKEALKTGKPFSEFCFTLGDKTTPMSSHWARVTMREILKQAELPHMRIHDLRHSYATIRLARGHNIGDVSYQMGHSSIKITFDTYTHWIPGRFSNEVDDLDLQPNATQAHSNKASNEKGL